MLWLPFGIGKRPRTRGFSPEHSESAIPFLLAGLVSSRYDHIILPILINT